MPLTYQLYSAHERLPHDTALEALGAVGVSSVEGYGPWLDDPGATRARLDALGMVMPSLHVALHRVEDDPVGVVADALTLGARHIYIPFLAPYARPQDAEGWRVLAQRLAKAGAPFRAAGLRFGWHNHDFELSAVPCGHAPLDIMAAAAHDLLFELDLGWIDRAGGDPVAWLRAYRGRISAVHLKDVTADGSDWADLGAGRLDWPAIHEELAQHGPILKVAERDCAPDPVAFARSVVAYEAGV